LGAVDCSFSCLYFLLVPAAKGKGKKKKARLSCPDFPPPSHRRRKGGKKEEKRKKDSANRQKGSRLCRISHLLPGARAQVEKGEGREKKRGEEGKQEKTGDKPLMTPIPPLVSGAPDEEGGGGGGGRGSKNRRVSNPRARPWCSPYSSSGEKGTITPSKGKEEEGKNRTESVELCIHQRQALLQTISDLHLSTVHSENHYEKRRKRKKGKGKGEDASTIVHIFNPENVRNH